MGDQEFKYDVFLSHASEDTEWCLRLAERLKQAGVGVWFDDWELRPGDNLLARDTRQLPDARPRGRERSESPDHLPHPTASEDWVKIEQTYDLGNLAQRPSLNSTSHKYQTAASGKQLVAASALNCFPLLVI